MSEGFEDVARLEDRLLLLLVHALLDADDRRLLELRDWG
jgi:hypothetical protein